jgi:hypothetical protein
VTKATSNLILHCGARSISEEELATVPTPEPELRWIPLSHISVLTRVKETLREAGYVVEKQRLGLSRGDARFFGTLDLQAELAPGVTLAVGVRSSIDRSLALGFVAGQRTLVCDNSAFRSDLLVSRKHTRFGEQRFTTAIANAVARLADFRKVESERIRMMRETELSADKADSLILTAYEKGIVSARFLPRIVREWRNPSFAEFRGKTLFNLLQSFTTVLGERAQTCPNEYAVQTMRLNRHLLQWKETPNEPHHPLAV